MQRIKGKKEWFKNTLILLISLVIILVFIEISLRIFYPQPVFKRTPLEAEAGLFNNGTYLPWELKPSNDERHISVVDEFNVSVKTNSLGYRDYDFGSNKPPGTERILVLGDSFTWGFGVELNETYVKQFEKLMNRGGEKYEVINAGYKSGYGPSTEYLYLREEGLLLKPDIVLVGFFVGNDFEDHNQNIFELDEEGELVRIKSKIAYVDEQGRWRINISEERPAYKEILYNVNLFMSFNSHFYILFKNSFRNVLIKFYAGNSEPNIYSETYTEKVEKDIEITLPYLIKIKELCDKRNVDLFVVLIPRRAEVYNYKIEDQQGEFLNWMKPYKLLEKFGEENKIKMINLLPYFKEHVSKNNTPLYFKIDPHWNANGHLTAAEAIYRGFLEEPKKIIYLN